MSAVFQAFDQDIARFITSVKTFREKENLKSILKLTDIWNTYDKKLPNNYFLGKLLEIGDFLSHQKWYKTSANECYRRLVCLTVPYVDRDNEKFASSLENSLKEVKQNDVLEYALCGLIGYSANVCYHLMSGDPLLKNVNSKQHIIDELKHIQLCMKKGLEKDIYHWIVYNGSVHVYAICSKLMSEGFAVVALEYLLWCCMCMELSVPLMAIRHLKWRVKLYASVSQCYYDIDAREEGEAFAKRSLVKIAEMQEIERVSTAVPTTESILAFKQSTLLMNIYVFKRSVVESRRRPKGVLRPKIKPLLKDIANNAWPRTGTERLLSELFSCHSAQFLAIIEALSTSNTRTLQTNTKGEDDEYLSEVNLELFFAGVGLITMHTNAKMNDITQSISILSLLELAMSDSNSLSVTSLVKFAKLTFNYENWESFDPLIQPIIDIVESFCDVNNHMEDATILRLLCLLSSVKTSKVKKKLVSLKTEEKNESTTLQKSYKAAFVDELLSIALLLHEFLCKNESICTGENVQIILDTVLQLWTKCRNHFSKITNDIFASHRAVYEDPLLIKWLKILILTYGCMTHLNANVLDALVVGEASLKILMTISCIMNIVKRDMHATKSSNYQGSQVEDVNHQLKTVWLEICEFLKIKNTEVSGVYYLLDISNNALSLIEKIRDVDDGNYVTVDQSFVVDSSRKLDFHQQQIQAVHLEVLYQRNLFHATVQNLQNINTDLPKSFSKISQSNIKKVQPISQDVITECGQNYLLTALYQLSHTQVNSSQSNESRKKIKEVNLLLEKAAQSDIAIQNISNVKPTQNLDIPPPPVLVHRSASFLVFKPAPFKSKERIYWVCLYVRTAAGNNVKVRLGDKNLKGTGEMVYFSSKFEDCHLKVEGLKPNEKYVAALAFYTKDGSLIGGAIGATTRPIMTALPLPLANAYSLLLRVAYRIGEYEVGMLAAKKLMDFYMERKQIPDSDVIKSTDEFQLQNFEFIEERLCKCSLIQYQYLIEVVFMYVSIISKEEKLYCDNLFANNAPLFQSQIKRFELCEKLVAVMKLCFDLNDHGSAMQACIQMYGLLAPFMFWKISLQPVVKVLVQVLITLKEIRSVFKKWKDGCHTMETLQHMIISISAFVAQSLLAEGKQATAVSVLELGNKLVKDVTSPVNTSAIVNADEHTVKNGSKRRKKRKGGHGGKVFNESSMSGNCFDSHILEVMIAKISMQKSHTDGDLELTGNEDLPMMQSVVSSLPATAGFKEVSKFKRRTQYLQGVATVISKAFHERLFEQVLDWTKESFSWISRRNEIVLNKTQPVVNKGAVITHQPHIEDDKLKKYSTAVVEYGTTSGFVEKAKASDQLKNSLNLPTEVSAKSQSSDDEGKVTKSKVLTAEKQGVQHKNGADKPIHQHKKIHSLTSDVQHKKMNTLTSEEKRMKEALLKIQLHLPDIWKSVQQKRRMRSIIVEEMPWRAQINLTNSKCYFQMAMDKLKLFAKRAGFTEITLDESFLDTSLFNLGNSGTIIVSWPGCMKEVTVFTREKTVDLGGKTIVHHSNNQEENGESSNKLKQTKKQSDSKGVANTQASKMDEAKKSFITHLEMGLHNIQKALVLSHRCHCWVLLQHASNVLYTSINMIMTKIVQLNMKLDKTQFNYPYDLPTLTVAIWKPLNSAAEFLLDLLLMTKETVEQSSDSCWSFNRDVYERLGDVKYSSVLGDHAAIVMWNIKNIVMLAVQVSYYREKWEHAVELITKFNRATNHAYSETLSPVLIVCQRFLSQKVNEGIEKNQTSKQQKFVRQPLHLPHIHENRISIEAHIDPKGHNIYGIEPMHEKVNMVPSDWSESLKQMSSAIDLKPHAMRMAEHSHKLLLVYLAARFGDIETDGKLLQASAQVSFVASEIKPLSSEPPNLSMISFETPEEVETIPAMQDQLPTIIASYKKSIDMLSQGQLSVFAPYVVSELGDILYHRRDKKGAYKCWRRALDGVFRRQDSKNHWRNYLRSQEDSMNRYRNLLTHCGVWGCLVASLLAIKMARYVMSSDMEYSNNLLHLASSLIKGLLCSTLGHPTSEIEYSLYELSSSSGIMFLVPGMNLFADNFAVNASVYLANLVWLSESLIAQQFFVQCQPILTVSQYIAHYVCQSLKLAVQIKIQRVHSLAAIYKFEEAIKYLNDIYRGENLPSPSEIIQCKVTNLTLKFDGKQQLLKNTPSLKTLCKLSLEPIHHLVYGKDLCHEIILARCFLLIKLASTIANIPVPMTTNTSEAPIDSQENLSSSSLDNKEQSTGRTNKEQSTSKIALTERKTFVEKEKELEFSIETANANNLKYYLLKTSGDAINTLLKEETTHCPIKCYMQLADIEEQRFCQINSFHHILKAIKFLKSVLETDADNIFDKKYEKGTGTEDAFGENIVDARIWLNLRFLACKYLYHQASINCIATYNGVDFQVFTRESLKDCKSLNEQIFPLYIEFSHLKMMLKKGEELKNILAKLKKIVVSVEQMKETSYSLKTLLYEVLMLSADLNFSANDDFEKSLETYNSIEELLLNWLVFHGFNIDKKTNYLIEYQLNDELLCKLVKVKSRIYRVTALIMSAKSSMEKPVSLDSWKSLLAQVENALVFSERLSFQDNHNRLELLSLKGEISRILHEKFDSYLTPCLQVFIEAIDTSWRFTRNFSLIQRFLMEMTSALIAASKSKLNTKSQLSVNAETNPQKGARRISMQIPAKLTKHDGVEKSSVREVQTLNRAAWLCVRSSALLAKAEQHIELMCGDITMLESTSPSDSTYSKLPQCIHDDLQITNELEWSRLLEYLIELKRCCEYPVFNSRANSQNFIPLDCYEWSLKLSELIGFLNLHLPAFSKWCDIDLPIYFIKAGLIDNLGKNSVDNLSSKPSRSEKASSPKPSGSEKTAIKGEILEVGIAGENELAIQWYRPRLQRLPSEIISGFAALNNKATSVSAPLSQFSFSTSIYTVVCTMKPLEELYKSMKEFAQAADAIHAAQGYPSRSAVAFTAVTAAQTVSKSPLQARKKTFPMIKPQAHHSKSDDNGENERGKFLPYIENFVKLLSDDSPRNTDQVFDASNWSNILCFLDMLNPTTGSISRVNDNLFAWCQHTFQKQFPSNMSTQDAPYDLKENTSE